MTILPVFAGVIYDHPMEKIKFYITDVFGKEKYAGNQLATFLDYGKLDTREMQKIAREINFSETTFITSPDKINGGFPVRIFTPEGEIDFAGHPTLGTAHIIKTYVDTEVTDKIILNLKVGQIPVEVSDHSYNMTQVQPHFGKEFPAGLIASVLGLQNKDITANFPICEVSTGLPFLIVPLMSRQVLQNVKINMDQYNRFATQTKAKGILIFAPEGQEPGQSLSVRVFVPILGIPEDPATGSGNGCLAAWLLKYNFLGQQQINIRTGQGYEMKRPSEITIVASLLNDRFDIHVGGKVIDIAEGYWNAQMKRD